MNNNSNERNVNRVNVAEKQTELLIHRRSKGGGQNKRLKYGAFATVFVAVALIAGVFSGCQKDTEHMESLSMNKRQKSMGNYLQPTQDVDINTIITVGDVEYPITGKAVVGSDNGQIYECNVTWTIQVDGTVAFIASAPAVAPEPAAPVEDITVHLKATLKSEYYDVLIPVAPIMDNYIIEITNPDAVTAENISDLWERVVEICNSNIEINYPFVLPVDIQPYQYAVQIADFSLAFEYMQTVFDSYQEGEEWGYFMLSLSDDHTLIYYGFITESSSYYNPDILAQNIEDPFIFIADPNDPNIIVDDGDEVNGDEEPLCYAIVRKFKHGQDAHDWVAIKRAKGRNATIVGSDKNGKFVCISYR